MAGELHVFEANATWIASCTKPYKVRKTHRKSRLGCKTCKLRRIKCDEAKPTCIPCQRKQLPCGYPEPINVGSAPNLNPRALIWPGKKTPPILTKRDSFSSDCDLAMLHHFVTITSQYFFDPHAMYGSQPINLLPLAANHAHIMHAAIAAAALHLRETAPVGKDYEEIETKHWMSASSDFRLALQAKGSDITAVELDPILTTCMLLNLLAFANVGSAEQAYSTDRWPFKPATQCSLQWLSVQLGLSPLLSSVSEHSKGNSIWLPLFLAVGSGDIFDESPGVEGIPTSFLRMFEITPSSFCEFQETASCVTSGHPYLRLVRRVVVLRKVYNEAKDAVNHNTNCLKYTQFIQAIDGNVVRRMEQRDPRTLLLYAHCMAMLCAVEHWWCRPRAMTECWAVTRWLDENHGSWLGLDGWLDFPAMATGYRLTWKERGLLAVN